MSKRRAESVLLVVMAAAVASTALHYTDNAVHLEEYPAGDWITPAVVVIAWVALTAVGLAGYALFARGRTGAAALCLAVYSTTGISSLGHYSYETAGYGAEQHVLILTDGMTGLAVLAFAAWAATRGRTLRRTA